MDKYVMTSRQLHVGDIVTESGIRAVTITGEKIGDTREVLLSAIELREIDYWGKTVALWYVSGTDLQTNKRVQWAASTWRRWITERNTAAPELATV